MENRAFFNQLLTAAHEIFWQFAMFENAHYIHAQIKKT